MSLSCHICYEWCPKNVDGFDAYDKTAYCKFLKTETQRDYACPHGAIVDPAKNKGVTHSHVRTKKEGQEIEKDIIGDKIKLFKHQQDAIERFEKQEVCALFFEMGCGKTISSLTLAARHFKNKEIDSLLVVAPNDVHKQWFDDLCNDDSVISKYLHDEENIEYTCQIVGGRGGQKVFYDFDYGDTSLLKIVCVNIDTFSTPHKWETVTEWAVAHKTMIILDEATVIKNPDSKRAQRMLFAFNDSVWGRSKKFPKYTSKKPNTAIRCVLTGTPVTNGPVDLWAIMEFLQPGYFGRNYYAFMNYYGMFTQLPVPDGRGSDRVIQVQLTEKTWQGIKNCESFSEAAAVFGCSEDTYMTILHQDKFMGSYKHSDELKEELAKVSVFAKLVDCVDMPNVNYIERCIGLSEAQNGVYNSMKQQLIAEYEGHIATAKNKLVSAIRLQQISSGFIMAHDDSLPDDESFLLEDFDLAPDEVVWLGDSNPRLDALMRDVDELDKPLLIMTRFSAEAAKIFDMLKDKYTTCLITGWKTIGSIAGFKNGDYDIMVANTTKIARGHNLQRAHVTLYYSNTFSMELRQQSEFRTFRIGQSHPCLYIDYVASSIDRTILKSLKQKKGFLDYIRSEDIKEVLA